MHEIVELHRAIRHADANRARQAACFARRDVARAEPTAGAVVAPGRAAVLGRFALRVELLGRAVAIVRAAALDERSRHRTIAIEAFGLKVRPVGSADVRPFVPVEPEPPQAVEDAFDHLARRAFGVGIFDAQDEHTAVAAREKPVEERGSGAADVQIAGWRRCEANARS